MKRNILAAVVLIAAVCFIALGIFFNDTNTVLNKAINICLECIGIG